PDGAAISPLAPWIEVGKGAAYKLMTARRLPHPPPAAAALPQGREKKQPHSGSGMNSVSSPGTLSKRRSFQSALACSMRSRREETKFHQMKRGPSIAAPPTSTTRAVVAAVTAIESPGRNTSNWPAPKRSPEIGRAHV